MSDFDETEIEFEAGLDETTEVDQIDETAAADTLKPHGAPGDSKAEMLSTFTSLLAQLGKEDLSSIFNQVQAQYGPNAKITNVGKSAEKNRATISVKEDVEEMFAGDDLSEEFMEKAEVVFEAAINTRLNLEIAKLEEEYEELAGHLQSQFDEAVEAGVSEIFSELEDQVDRYMDLTIKEWVEENQLAIDNGLRAEIAEDFISGLHTLFAEHYITVPEGQLDVMAEMKETIEDLQNRLDEEVNKNIELSEIAEAAVQSSIVEEMTDGLTMLQADKMRELSEGIEYSDAETFRKKLGILKENYFSKTIKPTGLITEEADESSEVNEQVSPQMSAYIKAASKSVKK